MRVQVDGGEVRGLAATLRADADSAHRLAVAAAGLAADAPDGELAASLRCLGRVCGDVLESVALDLDRLASTLRSAAEHYDDSEAAVLRAAGRPST